MPKPRTIYVLDSTSYDFDGDHEEGSVADVFTMHLQGPGATPHTCEVCDKGTTHYYQDSAAGTAWCVPCTADAVRAGIRVLSRVPLSVFE